MIKIASFGCGVDSVAGLLLSKEQGIEYDEIIFADTGSEKPETYQYLDFRTSSHTLPPGALEIKNTTVRFSSRYQRSGAI